MQRHHLYLSVLAAIAISTVITMASLRNRGGQTRPAQTDAGRAPKRDENEWPVAVLENQGQVEEEPRAKREVKSKRFDKSRFLVKGAVKSAHEDYTVILTEDWEVETPPLPISQSNVVLIGTILDAKGFVSADQTGVYSEFNTRVNEVLKADEAAAPLQPGDIISVQRAGGRVQGQAARVLFLIRGQNMPRQGGEYVMFLQRLDGGEDYRIITGYEIRGGKMSPLDSSDKFAAYSAMDRAEFLQALRAAGRPQ